jgi:hypothetical protein
VSAIAALACATAFVGLLLFSLARGKR